jgi:hypothetical protein
MRKIAPIALACCLMALIFFPATKLSAQESDKTPEAKTLEPPAHFYHLEFVVQETGNDGKPVNSRTYSGTVSTGRTDRGFSTRTGSKVPIATGGFEGSKNTQFQYIDVGVSIDARDPREMGDKLALDLVADISSLAGTQNINGVNEPVVRQNKWQAAVLIPIGKQTTVFTSDVLDSKGGMQLVVTATPVK